MKNSKLTQLSLLLAAYLLLAGNAHAAPVLIADWNFNNSNLSVSHGTGTMTTDVTVYGFTGRAGTTVNAVSGDIAGAALNAPSEYSNTNQNGKSLQWEFSLSGYKDMVLTLAAFKSGGYTAGFSVDYRLGTSGAFTNVTTFNLAGSYTTMTADFSTVTAVNNQSVVQVRLLFPQAGDWNAVVAFDNVQINATVPEPSTVLMLGIAGASLLIYRRRSRV